MEEGLSGRRGKTKKKLGLPETMRIDEIAGKNERDKKKRKRKKKRVNAGMVERERNRIYLAKRKIQKSMLWGFLFVHDIAGLGARVK